MARKLEAGDVVQLKSGGPLMTVDEVRGETAKLVWFDDHEMRNGTAPLSGLQKAND
ncbi:YodC family protein [Ahrensia sp. R2A130]|uniref:YodC family protein n=1 Tax=Ahrensia sp. R2A130 TaxID=744979 RepID=UPI0001E0CA5C|nr:DUF2158 domain-containing protein [Ahrensia sp. R2A130]EFL87654.1 conserved hypothetical protein [Ahrensia sp. R2A130]